MRNSICKLCITYICTYRNRHYKLVMIILAIFTHGLSWGKPQFEPFLLAVKSLLKEPVV